MVLRYPGSGICLHTGSPPCLKTHEPQSESQIQRGREEEYFPRPEANEKGCLGLFPDKVGRSCSLSGFQKNPQKTRKHNIPPSEVIQNVKYRQNFKGKKKKEVCLVGK